MDPDTLLDTFLDRTDRTTVAHAVGLLAFAVVYRWLLGGITVGRLYTFGDFPPYYGSEALQAFLTTWHDGGLGFAYLYNALPAYLGAVTSVGGVLAQNLFFLALIPAGFLTFLVFVDRFVDSLPSRYLGAGLYAINPVTIGEFVNGGVAALIGFAGLPLVLHWLYATVEEDSWPAAIRAGAAFGATTVSPWLGFWMVAPFATALAYRGRGSPRTLAKLVAAGTLGVGLALPSVHHVLQRVGIFDAGPSSLVPTLDWNYAAADPLTVVRLAGNGGDRAMNVLGYNSDPEMLIGLVVPLVALLAWRRTDLHAFYAVVGATAGCIVLTGTGLTYPVIEALPPLWSLRNPVKLQYPLLVGLAVLFAAGVETVLHRVPPDGGAGTGPSTRRSLHPRDRPTSGPPMVSALLVGLLVLSLVAYSAPAAGALGLQAVRGEAYTVPDQYATVTAEVDGRVLWVPYGYTTQLRLRHVYPDHVGIRSGGTLHDIQNTNFVTDLFADLAAGQDVHRRLLALGVTHVVVDGDAPERYAGGEPRLVERWGAPWVYGSPASFEARFDASPSFTAVDRADGYVVYAVADSEPLPRRERRTGAHAVVYPTVPRVDPVGPNLISNPSFDANTTGWWTPPVEKGTTATVVDLAGGERAVAIETEPSADQPLPIAQQVAVRDRHPYQVRVDGEGSGVLTLYWYDGAATPENLTTTDTVTIADGSALVTAEGSTLSVRIKPDERRVVVDSVALRRTTYPAATSFVEASAGVPGLVMDGRADVPSDVTVVDVNAAPATVDEAAVRLVDAETVLDGELVFDERYRQGVAVLVEDPGLVAAIPDGADVVAYDTPDGTVVDYWTVGAFDDTPVTLLFTSYDERWAGPPGATHVRANGWANGFVGAEPDEIRWSGGDRTRLAVVQLWLALWAVTIVGLGWSWRRPLGRIGRQAAEALGSMRADVARGASGGYVAVEDRRPDADTDGPPVDDD